MMTRTEIEAKLSGIENIEALIAQINNAEDDEAVLEILKQNGLELTEEDVHNLTFTGNELDEDDLDAVAGGHGCSCKGPLKRLIVNTFAFIWKLASGEDFTCIECGGKKKKDSK